MKAHFSILLLPLVVACGTHNDGDLLVACPKVKIRTEDKAIIQTAGGQDLFKIEMIGYNGHCYFDEHILKDKAVVTPKFKITRLEDTNVEDVHFSYYVETAEGPSKFLGKKTYFAEVRMPKGSYESYYTPNSGELSFAPGVNDFDMYAGMYAVKADSEYAVK